MRHKPDDYIIYILFYTFSLWASYVTVGNMLGIRPHVLGNGPHAFINGYHVLVNGYHVLGNGPHGQSIYEWGYP